MTPRVMPIRRSPRIRPTHPKPASLTILDAIADPQLFAPWFKSAETWAAWFAFLATLFALPMTASQLATYRECTGRNEPPSSAASEAWLVIGRRGGKSFIMALVAVFLACFFDYRRYLSPGERATIMVIAADRRQARIVLRYVRALLSRIPMLSRMVEREAVESFDLVNETTIEVHSASFRSTRGYTLAAVIADEIAFWPTDDAAEPDYEVLNALRPGMATIPNAMLLCASSPYARRGALWDAHRRHFGRDGDPILVWQAGTRTMNPTVRQSVIDEAMERDPASASAEFGAQFRSDIESFVSREAVQDCIAVGVRERPFVSGVAYRCFLDPAGGSGQDSMTLAIAHKEDNAAILDVVRERRPPFSPDDVVNEFAALIKSYGIRKVAGDRFGGEWCREPFRKHGIEYTLSELPKSGLYQAFLPVLNSKRADLLDHDRLFNQLVSLERRTSRGGKDSIDHPPGQHDDLANVVAGVFSSLTSKRGSYDSTLSWVGGPDEDQRPVVGVLNRFILTGGLYR